MPSTSGNNNAYRCKRQSTYSHNNKKCEADGKRSSKPKGNSSQICKYWINGNCVHGDHCWNLHSWFYGDGLSILTKLHQHKTIMTGITLPVGSDKLFSCSTDRTLRVWDCHTGECVNVINLGEEARCLISMGSWVFAGLKNAVKAWNIQTAAEITLDGPKGPVLSMAVCNDTIFTGAMDGVIYAWRLTSEANFPFKPVATLNGHTRAVVSLTGGPGYKLYSGSVDHSIKVWDLNTLQCTMTLKGHNDVVTSLIFWDKYLFSSSLDGTVKLWTSTDHEQSTMAAVYTHQEESGVVRITGMTDAKGKPILFCSCSNHLVSLYEMPTFAARGRLFSKQEIRVIEEGPGGLFFTGDGTGLLTVWKWQADESEPMATSS
ncbi:zinc finger CCCH domain-containing protein 48-like [Neltuma alba]|uniref:zinc finger CCCH domain-containing protein 48-like n=1 Tax=Neltuma alba TaxID=207710 RepID=UPI0010A358B1|nr:zinc finger CCCH domain-containing protein 48-like [Prosopis alba]XP_028800057.1 zinc finger CCCH domain-containing protein 48-like [Prosopis alba]